MHAPPVHPSIPGPPPRPHTQVLAASGTELQVVRGEAGGQPQLGPLVDMAVYSK